MNETTELIMRQLNQKKTHAITHEVGGGDEIDATRLKNIDNYLTTDGDFTGTWNGLEMTAVEPGLSTSFNALKTDVTQRAINVKYPPSPLVEAKGDGVTNDIAALNAMIIAVSQAGGGVVFFPKGTYYIDNTGSSVNPANPAYAGIKNLILYPNVTLEGVGKSSVIKFKNSLSSANNFIYPYDGTHAYSQNNVIRNLSICSEYTGSNPDTTDSSGLWGTLKNALIENVWFYDLDSDAVCLAGDTGENSENVIVRNCIINRTGRHGLTIIRGYNITFENNTISNCATGSGLHCEQTTDVQPESFIKIINNRVDTAVNGVFADMVSTATGNDNARNIIVRDNTLTNLSSHGIRFDSLMYGKIEGNYIREAATIGIFVGSCSDVVVAKNDVIDSGALGIYSSISSRVDILHNHIRDEQSTKTTTVGIQIIGTNFSKVCGNTVLNTLRSGITLQNISHSHIDSNSVENPCIGRADSNDAGLLFNFSGGDVRVNNMIKDNAFIDTQGVPTMYRAMNLRGTTYTNTLVAGNVVSGWTAGNYIFSDAMAINNLG